MRKKAAFKSKSAIDIIEEAFTLLRTSPESTFPYYAGSLPFILGLLYFWADMSHAVYDTTYVAKASFGLALLFLWMKYWHAVFAEKITSLVSHRSITNRPLAQMISLAANQSLIHCSVFFVLPLSFLFGFPFAWMFAFYHSSSSVNVAKQDIKAVSQEAWKQAKLWPRQNMILVSLFFLFYITVFFNVSITLFSIPYFLKRFLGIETIFTLSGANFFNTTFLATASCLTYLCVNPVIKTVYAIRCFYGNSIRSGEDLKADINLLKAKNALFLFGLIALLCSSPSHLMAEESELAQNTSLTQDVSMSLEALDASIDSVLARREFVWRMRQEKVKSIEKDNSPLTLFFEWLGKIFKAAYKYLRELGEKIAKWLDKIKIKFDIKEKKRADIGIPWLRTSLYSLLFFLSAALIVFLFVIYKMKRSQKPTVAKAPEFTIPNIRDEKIKADELPPDQWIILANALLEKGDLRHALRAFYLATLSHLAKREIISIKRYKSNHDYETELRRRAHQKGSLLEIFSNNVLLFDSAWYGRRVLNKEDVLVFAQDQEKIVQLANA